MKILVKGEILKFKCASCNCEYITGINEARNCGFFRDAECPECGTRNAYSREDSDQDHAEKEPEIV